MSELPGGLDLEWFERVLIFESTESQITRILGVENSESVVPEGENYCSVINRVKLKCEFQNGVEKYLSVIIKRVITSDEKNVVFEMLPGIFKIEIEVYSIIFPMMEKLMAEFKDEREKLWCNFYGQSENRAIILEDLTVSGFKTLRKTDWISYEYSAIILKDLARFHAMSKILIDRGLLEKSNFDSNNMCTFVEFGQKLYAGPLEVLAEVMVDSWGDEWKGISERIKLQVPLVAQKINELAAVQDDRFLVFSHGDLWTCNVMMKIKEDSTIESLKFLDFQLPFMNSFIWDVVIFMFTSVNPEVRRSKQHDLLTIFHESLQENLRLFNCQSYIPTMDDVTSEFERLKFVSFIFNMTFFPMSSSSKCKPFEIGKILDFAPQEVFDKNAFTDERLVPELKKDLTLYVEKGVI